MFFSHMLYLVLYHTTLLHRDGLANKRWRKQTRSLTWKQALGERTDWQSETVADWEHWNHWVYSY